MMGNCQKSITAEALNPVWWGGSNYRRLELTVHRSGPQLRIIAAPVAATPPFTELAAALDYVCVRF